MLFAQVGSTVICLSLALVTIPTCFLNFTIFFSTKYVWITHTDSVGWLTFHPTLKSFTLKHYQIFILVGRALSQNDSAIPRHLPTKSIFSPIFNIHTNTQSISLFLTYPSLRVSKWQYQFEWSKLVFENTKKEWKFFPVERWFEISFGNGYKQKFI